MKSIINKVLMSVAVILVFTACEVEEYTDVANASANYVGVKAVPANVVEGTASGTEVIVPFRVLSPGVGAFSVTFTVTGTAQLGTDFTVPAAESTTATTFTLAMPASESVTSQNADFTIVTVANAVEGEANLVIAASITDISSDDVFTGYPLDDSFSITILDDDCAYDYTLIEGVLEGYDANFDLASESPYTSIAEFTYIDASTIEVVNLGVPWMNDWWGETVVTYNPVVLEVDEFGVGVEITEFTVMETTYNGAPQDPYLMSGSGLINTCAGTITLEYSLCNYGECWNETYAAYNLDGGTMFKAVFQLPEPPL